MTNKGINNNQCVSIVFSGKVFSMFHDGLPFFVMFENWC